MALSSKKALALATASLAGLIAQLREWATIKTVATSASSAQAQIVPELPKADPARIVDRLSIVMRGIPAADFERNLFSYGKIDLKTLAEKYKKDNRFREKLAQYWTYTLKIKGPFNLNAVTDTASSAKPTLRGNLNVSMGANNSRSLIFRKPSTCSESDLPRFELYLHEQTTLATVTNKKNECDNIKIDTDEGINRSNRCLSELDRLQRMYDTTVKFTAIHNCSCADAIEISPWWNLNSKVRVCPSTIQSRQLTNTGDFANADPNTVAVICGTNLTNCMPLDSRIQETNPPAFLAPMLHSGNNFIDEVIKGFTLEPGMLIAKTIQDDLDFRSALTTTKTTVNASVETLLKSARGTLLRNQTPGRFEGGVNLTDTHSSLNSWRWVERGEGNAGVLTTPQFHQVTNGYRAKANRAYETFLCRQFIIPPGVVEVNPLEQDLTKRQPCASCHIELEPLSKMFNRWPVTGINYFYNPTANADGGFTIHPTGKFEPGTDVPGAARAFVQDERFVECAVQRAFEFLTGQAPTEFEVEHSFPAWKNIFVAQGYKVWPVMQEIIQSSYFQGGWK